MSRSLLNAFGQSKARGLPFIKGAEYDALAVKMISEKESGDLLTQGLICWDIKQREGTKMKISITYCVP